MASRVTFSDEIANLLRSAHGNPVQIERAEVVHPDGRRVVVIADGGYVL